MKNLCAAPAPTESQTLLSELTVDTIQDIVRKITQIDVEKTRLQLLVISVALTQGLDLAFLDKLDFHKELAKAVCISRAHALQPAAANVKWPALGEAQKLYNLERAAAQHAGDWVDGNSLILFLQPHAEQNKVRFPCRFRLTCLVCLETPEHDSASDSMRKLLLQALFIHVNKSALWTTLTNTGFADELEKPCHHQH